MRHGTGRPDSDFVGKYLTGPRRKDQKLTQPFAIISQIINGHLVGRHKPIVFFHGNGQLAFAPLEFKQGDCFVRHELGSDRPANRFRKLVSAHCLILFDLDDTQPVFSGLGLDRNNIVNPFTVQTDVQFIGFHLTDMGRRGPQVILE